MMKTLEEIRNELETTHPVLTKSFNGEEVTLSREERKETLDFWASNLYSKEVAIAEAADKAAARQAVLARLGLTEEEAQLILGGSN
jgi:hypothetical protein